MRFWIEADVAGIVTHRIPATSFAFFLSTDFDCRPNERNSMKCLTAACVTLLFAQQASANVAFQSGLTHLMFETGVYKVEIGLNEKDEIDRFRVWVGGKELRIDKSIYKAVVRPSLLDVRLIESAGADGAELEIPVPICDERGPCGKKEVWSFYVGKHEFLLNQHYTATVDACGR